MRSRPSLDPLRADRRTTLVGRGPRHLLLAGALLAGVTNHALGQGTPGGRVLEFHATAGGALPLGGELDPYHVGAAAGLGLRWRSPTPWLGVQVDALHTRMAGDDAILSGPADAPVRVEPRTSVTALTTSAVVAPLRTAPVRPYLLAGGGGYRLSARDRVSGGARLQRGGSGTAAGVVYGGGVDVPVGRVTTFLDVRHHIVFRRRDNTSVVPVTLGIRF